MTINTQIKHLKKIKIKLTLKFTQMTKVQNRCEIETQFSERDREEKKIDLLVSCRICIGPNNYLYIEFEMKV